VYSKQRELDETRIVAESGEQFLRLIFQNAFLTNDALFMQYYSTKEIFHNPLSMTEFILPDVKPLPSIVNFKKT